MINPETTFIRNINRQLKKFDPPPIIKKLSDRFTQGWPDVYYISPFFSNLWVEYKIHPNKPTKIQESTLIQLASYNEHVAVIIKNGPSFTIINYLTNSKIILETTNPTRWIATKLGYLICEN